MSAPAADAAYSLRETELPLIVIDARGCVIDRGCGAMQQLRRLESMQGFEPGSPLPEELLHLLNSTRAGEANVWYGRGESGEQVPIGCTHYSLGNGRHALLIRDIGDKQDEVTGMLHKQRLESLGRLATSVAHDLRTCVASIVYNADALGIAGGSGDGASIPVIAAEIRQASDRLQRTIDNLLDFGRVGPEVTEPVELQPVLRRIARWVEPILKSGKHELSWDGASIRASGNLISIEQVLLNLILNAVEAVDQGARVHVRWRREGDYCLIRVSDHGPGVPEDVIPRLFEPFFTTKKTGTGLGLFSARETAHRVAGDLWLESACEPCCFAFKIPFASLDLPVGAVGPEG